MTESELRQKAVNTAIAYIGYKESDGSFKAIIDGYNAHTPLAVGYKVKYTDEWCATFVSFVAIKAGLTDIMPTECGCERMIKLYKALGRWQENDAYVPAPGDVIMFDWGDSGTGDCTGWADHTGLVESVFGGYVNLIEGNKGNAVARRKLALNARYIRGWCLPNYASKATSAESTAPTTTTGLAVGDKVKLTADAVIYGTSRRFASFIYTATLYVRQVNGSRIVISTQASGAVTGAVDRKYLVKV